jgi:hypothetical protein
MSSYTKEDLAEIKAQIDSWDLCLFKNMGKSTAECDENGVVFIKDEDGHTRMMRRLECARIVLN